MVLSLETKAPWWFHLTLITPLKTFSPNIDTFRGKEVRTSIYEFGRIQFSPRHSITQLQVSDQMSPLQKGTFTWFSIRPPCFNFPNSTEIIFCIYLIAYLFCLLYKRREVPWNWSSALCPASRAMMGYSGHSINSYEINCITLGQFKMLLLQKWYFNKINPVSSINKLCYI